MSTFDMPPDLMAKLSLVSIDLAEGLSRYWIVVTLGCLIFGIVVIILALMSVYDSYKYNRHDYRKGAILKFVCGVLLVNINFVVTVAVYYAT